MTQDIVEFARRVVAERRAALGDELLKLHRSGVSKISFDDLRIRPFFIELELAEQLCTFAEDELVRGMQAGREGAKNCPTGMI